MNKFFLIVIILVMSISIIWAQDVTLLESYQSTIVVRVNIDQPWVDTGINILQENKVDIIAKGLASSDESHSNWWCGPEGLNYSNDTGLPLPNVPNQSLIAKIGENGTPFYIGRGISFISNVAGSLFLGYNDYGFTDNIGFYVAFISGDPVTTGMDFNERISSGPNFDISQNFPNPFNPTTTIEYQVTSPQNITIDIFDINGRLVKNLVKEYKNSGNHSIQWDGTDNAGKKVSSSTYFYQLSAANYNQAKKMILLK